MKKVTLLLAAALAFSLSMFAQEAPAQSDTQSSASQQQSTQQSTSKATSTANLTADQKAELKQLKEKAHTACKADANSDACKQAKQDLHSKMSEYGVQPQHQKSGQMEQGGQNPPPQ